MKIAGAECYFSLDMTGKPDRIYIYKIPPNVEVRSGDLVVAPRNQDGFCIVTVHRINPDMEWRPGVAWKWLVQRVDVAEYKARLALEKATSK